MFLGSIAFIFFCIKIYLLCVVGMVIYEWIDKKIDIYEDKKLTK